MLTFSVLSSTTTVGLWTLIAMGFAIYYFNLALYRVYLHPLSKYPGNLSNKISSWPNWHWAAHGYRHLELARQHAKYGPIVRIGPNAVSLNTVSALHDIHAPRKANVIKSDYYTTIALTEGGTSTFSTRDPTEHAQKRRLLSQAFSEAALRDAEPQILAQVRKWATLLTAEGEERDMAHWSDLFAFDVLSDLLFGRSFDVLSDPSNRYIVSLIGQSVKFVYIVGNLPLKFIRWVLFASPLSPILGGQTVRDFGRLRAFCTDAISQRQKVSVPRRDFFHHLFSGTDPVTGEPFASLPPTAFLPESTQLLVAGSDTSSTTLAALFFYLTRRRNAPILARLTAEIRAAFALREDIKWKGITADRLPYLRAVVDETLRMAPPTVGRLPREVLPGGIVIDGNWYPAGTEVGICIYALHHKKEYFPEPYAFRPERWLVEEVGAGSEELRVAQSAFCPFSLGSRGCVGKNLAYLEIGLALCWVLWGWDVEAVEGKGNGKGSEWTEEGGEEEYLLYDCFVAQRQGPLVKFRRKV